MGMFRTHNHPPARFARLVTVIALLDIMLVGDAFGQATPVRHNAVYLEILGNAVAYSINYERRIAGPEHVRIGGGYLALPETDGAEVDGLGLLPFMVGFANATAQHGVELGIGVAPVFTRGNWDDVGILGSDTRVVGTGTLGYRYAPRHSGVLVRVGFTPLFGAEGVFPWGGASVGYRF